MTLRRNSPTTPPSIPTRGYTVGAFSEKPQIARDAATFYITLVRKADKSAHIAERPTAAFEIFFSALYQFTVGHYAVLRKTDERAHRAA